MSLFLKAAAIIFLCLPSLCARAQEVGTSGEEYYPAPRVRPVPRPERQNPSAAPVESMRPFARPLPLRELTETEIAELQSRPCPGSEFCPGPYQDFARDGQYFSPLCSEFIDSEGNYGETGLMIYEAMQQVERTNRGLAADGTVNPGGCSFRNNIDFGRACPNYQYMNGMQKDHVWVWLWASIAQAESSCDPAKDAEGVFNEVLGRNNLADGLFGLEYSADTRRVAGRDPRFCPHVAEADSKNLFFQTRCAASIMYDRFCNSSVVNSESYWEQLRTNQRKISQLVQRHPLCQQ